MPGGDPFEYTVIRIVPRVEREEFINAGVILYCRAHRYLDCRVRFNPGRLACLARDADIGQIEDELGLIAPICRGGAGAGPLGEMEQAERFRWLAAPRSTTVQFSPVHGGMCEDPTAALDKLFEEMVE